MEKKIRQKMMMEQAYHEAVVFKEMRMQAEKEEEDQFRRTMMDKFAEDDRIDQMNAQRRRMKQLEHRREVEKLLEARRREREADKVQHTECFSFNETRFKDNYLSVSSRNWRLKKEQSRSKERPSAER